MKILDKTEDGNLDEQEKIKKASQETEWELKPQYVIIALVVFVMDFVFQQGMEFIYGILR